MSEEVELASCEAMAAYKALWLMENPDREPSTTKQWYKKWKYTDEHKQELQQIATEYQSSEMRRKEARPWSNKPAEERKKRKLDAEDEHFERVFKEKFEDPNYYGVR